MRFYSKLNIERLGFYLCAVSCCRCLHAMIVASLSCRIELCFISAGGGLFHSCRAIRVQYKIIRAHKRRCTEWSNESCEAHSWRWIRILHPFVFARTVPGFLIFRNFFRLTNCIFAIRIASIKTKPFFHKPVHFLGSFCAVFAYTKSRCTDLSPFGNRLINRLRIRPGTCQSMSRVYLLYRSSGIVFLINSRFSRSEASNFFPFGQNARSVTRRWRNGGTAFA